MEPIDANASLPATLTATEWNVVLSALHEIPYKLAAPIIPKLAQQLQAPNGEAKSNATDR